MNKYLKSILSAGICSAICLSMALPTFAASNKPTTTTKTNYHNPVWLEEDYMEKINTNESKDILGDVYEEALPSVVTGSGATVMAFIDVASETVTKTTYPSNTEEIEGGTITSGGGTSTSTVKALTGLYSIYDNTKKVWGKPKKLPTSTPDSQIATVELFSNGKEIYLASVEADMDIGEDVLSALSPETKLIVYKYNVTSDSFTPVKTIEEKGYTNLELNVVFEKTGIAVTWVSAPQTPLLTMALKGYNFECKFIRLSGEKWTEPQTLFKGSLNSSDDVKYKTGTINGKIAVMFCTSPEKNAKLSIYTENDSLHIDKNISVSTVGFGNLGTLEDESFYAVMNKHLYKFVASDDGKMSAKIVIKNIGNVIELKTSQKGVLYVLKGEEKTLYARDFDYATMKHTSAYKVDTLEFKIAGFDASVKGGYTVVLLLTDMTSVLTGPKYPVDDCGHTISFILHKASKTQEQPTEPTAKPDTTEKPSVTDKPSDTTNPAPSKPENTTTPDIPVISETDDENYDNGKYEPDNSPDTGAAITGTIVALSMLGLGSATIIAAKKKISKKR